MCGAMESRRRYVLIAPCRDEAEYLRRSLDSIAAQSNSPTLCVVVDDGSTDETPAILREYSERLPQLRVVTRQNRGCRNVGPGVVDAFYAGLHTVDLDAFDYVCKIDLDLDLPPRYFETLMDRMEADPRLGTTSGKPYFEHPKTGQLIPEVCGDEMSVGMTKFYRVECFRDVGGFVREVMWDGSDCHECRRLGWIAESVDQPELRFLHLRPEGSSQTGIWTGRVRHGFGQYFMGTSPGYLLASALFRLPSHPVVAGSAAMVYGYARSAWRKAPRYGDDAFRRHLRAYQRECLLLGKRGATRRTNERQAAVWHARRGGQPTGVGSPRPRREVVLGCPLDNVTMQSAVELCVAWCKETPRRTRTVVTPNASILTMLRKDPDLARACRAADLVVADGMALIWASRLLGSRLPERVAGIDFMQELLHAASKHKLRVYFLGAKPDVVSELVKRCQRQFPGAVIAGYRDGYFSEAQHAEVVRAIRESEAQMLFIGMPAPFNETWPEKYREELNVPVIMGVGGSFDVLAGFVARAPRWVQSAGMEWSWRLMKEPRRLWKRYLTTNSEFIWLAASAAARRHLTPRFTPGGTGTSWSEPRG